MNLRFALFAALSAGTVLATSCSKPQEAAPRPAAPPGAKVVEMTVTGKGYEPDRIEVKRNEPLALMITRKTEKTCATEIVIDEFKIKQELPLDKTVMVTFTPTVAGELVYGCAMDKMLKGTLIVN